MLGRRRRALIGPLLACALVLPTAACVQDDSKTARPSLPAPPNATARWYEIARTPAIVAYLDTARVERPAAGVARIWFRFAYATPMTVGADTATAYAASEAREELDCANRRTKDLELRLETTTGIATGSPLPTPAWKPIDTHPLGSGVFLVACRALGTPIPSKAGA
jgi:hypothetical protein